MLAALDRIAAALSAALTAIAALALFALVPLAGWLVFGRYVLNALPTWVEATSLVLVLVVTFAVAASATRSEDHLAIVFVREALPRPAERALRFAAHLGMLTFGAWMAAASWSNAAATWSRPIPLLPLPEGARHVPLVVGGVGIALFSTIHALKMLLGRDEATGERPDGAG
ncbi:TRAP transporter small permease [Acuticoccus sp.]|uniref:TRAP transporter small permease n=1 Tax=Acuticoccus sp. TaxID=1904378 RepID=UPI003B5154FF